MLQLLKICCHACSCSLSDSHIRLTQAIALKSSGYVKQERQSVSPEKCLLMPISAPFKIIMRGGVNALIIQSSRTSEVTYKPVEQRIYINKQQYLERIAPEVWGFKIGGYQVLDKCSRIAIKQNAIYRLMIFCTINE